MTSETETATAILHRWLPTEHGITRAELAITAIEVRWHRGDCILTIRPAGGAALTAVLPPQLAAHLAARLTPPAPASQPEEAG